MRETRSANTTIAFTRNEQWRLPSIVLGEPRFNELSEGVDVLADAEEFLAEFGLGDPAKAGCRSVDHHDVSEIEPGI